MNRTCRSLGEKFIEIGQAYKSSGKLVMARDYITRSLALYEMRDEQRLFGLTHQHLGKTLEKQNDFDGAEKEYREVITIEEELEDDVAASICHTSLELLLKRGKKQKAEQEAQKALAFAKQNQNVVTQGQVLMTLAQIRHDAKDYTAADQLYESISMH